MFTGFIQQTGKVLSLLKKGDSAIISIETALDMSLIHEGDSIAVNGACLTVTKISGGAFSADVSFETLAKTTLGELKPGAAVNLETPMTPASGFHGHFVQGHVDGVGKVSSVENRSGVLVVSISFPTELRPYIAHKGSIAVDGVSLTVNEVADDKFKLALIPHTLIKTTLNNISPGMRVNLEVDVIARYLERLIENREKNADATVENKGLTEADLAKNGFI